MGNHSSILPGETHGQRSYSPWGHKESQTYHTNVSGIGIPGMYVDQVMK